MDLATVLLPDRIRVPLLAQTKAELIAELVQIMAEAGDVTDPKSALDAVLKRESERTTGIGYGLAIPHGKLAGVTRLVIAAGKPANPVDFQSLDGRPVTFIVLLLSPPDQTSAHIQALAKISRLMNLEDFRKSIEAATSATDLHAAIAQAESAIRA